MLRLMKLLDESSFHAVLRASPRISVVMFSGPDCGACRRLEKHIPDWLSAQASHFYKIDVQKSTGLARAYEVFHLPSLFVFVDGCYHAPLQAEAAPGPMQAALQKLLSLPAQEEP
jgi:thioredoxin 1